jgi:hypothetical protein
MNVHMLGHALHPPVCADCTNHDWHQGELTLPAPAQHSTAQQESRGEIDVTFAHAQEQQ